MDMGSPSRRSILKGGLSAAAGLAGATTPPAAATAAEAGATPSPRRPNILFILVDEQRYPVAYESEELKRFRSERLIAQRQLAAAGTTFERHYVASVACVPSRTSLYTGHYPSLHGVANTDGAAKTPDDPGMHWLQPGTIPTLGNYLRAGGYRTFWKGKWHASETDLMVPGTHTALTSYDENGFPDPAKEKVYLAANQLDAYGFNGWVGPEPHGADPLRSGSSVPKGQQGRDPAIAEQVVSLLKELAQGEDKSPWFIMASFTNPHDIALWGFFSNLAARLRDRYDFSVPDHVPTQPFEREVFARSRFERLADKPSCQRSYRDAYGSFMQPSLASEAYYRLYYKLHEDVDRHLAQVVDTLEDTHGLDNTIIVFTSDHGDLLGAHGGLFQKWYMAYEEALHVPLVVLLPGQAAARSITMPTSHIDIAPTILGLAGLDREALRAQIAPGFSDPLPMVGRDLSALLRGEADEASLAAPVYFMTDDDPSRGLDQKNFIGLSVDSVAQPNHVETVIAEIDGALWKYSRYFDHPRYWSDPGTPGDQGVRDVVVKLHGREKREEGTTRRLYEQDVKTEPAKAEFELYNVTADPLELDNLAGKPAFADRQAQLAKLLEQQAAAKRLTPKSGAIPGEPPPR